MDKIQEFLRLNKKPLLRLLVFLLLASIFLTWFLEYRYFINNSSEAWRFLWERPLVFWYNTFLMFLMLCFIVVLMGRPILAASILWGVVVVVTYIHINKFNTRGFPLLPEDFVLATEATSLAKFIDTAGIVKLVVAGGLIITLGVLGEKWLGKNMKMCGLSGKEKTQRVRANRLIGRGVTLILTAIVFIGATDFVRNHNGQRYEDLPWLNSQLVAWNQVRNYDYNGFILGFLYNWQKFKLEAPEDYSEEKIQKIGDTYAKLADKNKQGSLDLEDEDIDIVVILNESFFDPAVSFQGEDFATYYSHDGGEVLPNLRKIQSQYPSGYMYSTDYGGGTANIEFEVLTGMSNYFTNTVPYTDLIPRAKKTPSMASFLKGQGYGTTAIHPFNGSMYKRNIVFENFGFDNFITDLEMDYREMEGRAEYINDRSAYRQTLDALSQDGKQFVTLITMQNHLPYNPDIYDQTDFAVTNQNLEEWKRNEIETYYQMLHNSDQYLNEFIMELDKSDKKTAVLFFGDHSAGIFELTNSSDDKKVRDLSRLTPYFIYANFDLAGFEKNLPTTTPNCLSNTLFNALGVKKPRINYLLDEICAESPILANAWLGEDGAINSQALKNYELVIYDLLGGKKYWEN